VARIIILDITLGNIRLCYEFWLGLGLRSVTIRDKISKRFHKAETLVYNILRDPILILINDYMAIKTAPESVLKPSFSHMYRKCWNTNVTKKCYG
jgi:hypothetical protein